MAIINQLRSGTLSLNGNQGPVFETEGQRATSNIQALSRNNVLRSSQDMILGRRYGRGQFTTFVSPSTLDNSALPVNGEYRDRGPRDGRY